MKCAIVVAAVVGCAVRAGWAQDAATVPTLPSPPATAPAGDSAGAAGDEPLLPPLTTRPGHGGDLSTRPSVVVSRFKFTGNRHVPDAELAKVVEKYVGRPLAVEDLEEARVDLTRHLVDKGYINSGAVLPDQTVEDGVVTFDIVEGRLSEVRVTGTKILRGRYIQSRLERAGRAPLDILKLKDALELLRQDPNVRSINAELRPGAAPGEGVLDVTAKEKLAELPPSYLQDVPFFRRLEPVEVPLSLRFQYSNRRPPSVGSTAVDVLLTDYDLTGRGDQLFLRYDVANGPPVDIGLAGAEDFTIDYTLPVSAADTTVNFNFTRTDSVVVETPFEDLNINSRSNSYAVTVRQPIYRRPTYEAATATSRAKPALDVALFGAFAYREDETTLLGRPFEFSQGTSGGKSRVWVLRFGQELTARTPEDALSVRSTFSFGLPIFGATRNGTFPKNPSDPRFNRDLAGKEIPDGQFAAWLMQAQYVRRLGRAFQFGQVDLSDTQFVVRGAFQLSNSPLLPTEQFAVGGFDTVRGYRENQLVRDEGYAAGAEFRIPLLRTRGGGDDVLTLVPFTDVGAGTDLLGTLGTTNLWSVGAGLVFAPGPHVIAQLYYGYALINRNTTHQDLQDVGLHFSVTVTAF